MLTLVCTLAHGGCSFESSQFADLSCEDEGERRDSYVCRDGFWVDTSSGPDLSLDQGGSDMTTPPGDMSTPTDMPDPTDTGGPVDMDSGLDTGPSNDMGPPTDMTVDMQTPDMQTPIDLGTDAGMDVGVDAGPPDTGVCDCIIDTTCYASGDRKPDAPCMACRPALSDSSWSPLADDTSCAPASADPGCTYSCSSGSCTIDTVGQCHIDAMECFADGARNPANDCQFCEAPAQTSASIVTAWSQEDTNTACTTSGGGAGICDDSAPAMCDPCASAESVCDDGVDGDCDGLIDCADVDDCDARSCTNDTGDVGVCQAGSCCIPLTERRAICALNLLCGGSHTNLADGCGGTISATISCQRDDCPATHPDCPRGGPNQGQCKMQ